MTLCPIAAAVTCKKCPAFRVCPAKSILGDQKKPNTAKPDGGESKSENS